MVWGGDQVPPNRGPASGVWKGRTKQRAKAFRFHGRFTATQIRLVKSMGNLQFPPTYRALPKNIIELEEDWGGSFLARGN